MAGVNRRQNPFAQSYQSRILNSFLKDIKGLRVNSVILVQKPLLLRFNKRLAFCGQSGWYRDKQKLSSQKQKEDSFCFWVFNYKRRK
ncbi:MAG: hypothetical protein DBX52_03265 [Clostridiales bacterium]|nr:MAG: hypothetical protein DBX52_03265 [Clostridiales bacterium]